MEYVEAFKKLGYTCEAPRLDWSAEKSDGVCITIWQKERQLDQETRLPYFDLWELHPHGGDWEQKSGHRKRKMHLTKAVEQLDSRIDVIFVSGVPGGSYQSASPWVVSERGYGWVITKFDHETGFFRAEIDKPKSTG